MSFNICYIGDKKMKSQNKKQILKLIQKVNQSKKRIQRGLYPLEIKDDGWRIVLPKSLEKYTFIPAGKKLLEIAVFDIDFQGGYYWIPYAEPPSHITTPAIRLMNL
jgi:hypothetical protein